MSFLAYTVKYTTMISIVKEKCGSTTHKVGSILKELTDVINNNISSGNDIDCLNLFTIKYTTSKDGKIYNNNIYDFKQQVYDISKNLYLSEIEVSNVLKTYYQTCNELLVTGNQINIKSVGYVEPRYNKDTKEYVYFNRISPSLVNKKTKKADFMILLSNGITVIKELDKKDLRFSMELNENLIEPDTVNEKEIRL